MYAITITITHTSPSPVVGWVLDGTKVATWPTADEAERAMNKLRRDHRYSWKDCHLDVAEYGGKK